IGTHPDVTAPGYVALPLDPLLSQAARLNGTCRLFAPHYRQITFGTFASPDSAHFLDLAYRDVLDAWRLYLKNDNGGRNAVILGASQSTLLTPPLPPGGGGPPAPPPPPPVAAPPPAAADPLPTA